MASQRYCLSESTKNLPRHLTCTVAGVLVAIYPTLLVKRRVEILYHELLPQLRCHHQ